MNLSINLKFALALALLLLLAGIALAAHAQTHPGQSAADVPAQSKYQVNQTSTGANSPNISGTNGSVEIKPDAKPDGPSYVPSESQADKLRIGQLAAQLAQSNLAAKEQSLPEFAQFQQALTALQQECAKVIAANKWPAGTVCDIQQIPVKFSMPASANANAPNASVPTPAAAGTPKAK